MMSKGTMSAIDSSRLHSVFRTALYTAQHTPLFAYTNPSPDGSAARTEVHYPKDNAVSLNNVFLAITTAQEALPVCAYESTFTFTSACVGFTEEDVPGCVYVVWRNSVGAAGTNGSNLDNVAPCSPVANPLVTFPVRRTTHESTSSTEAAAAAAAAVAVVDNATDADDDDNDDDDEQDSEDAEAQPGMFARLKGILMSAIGSTPSSSKGQKRKRDNDSPAAVVKKSRTHRTKRVPAFDRHLFAGADEVVLPIKVVRAVQFVDDLTERRHLMILAFAMSSLDGDDSPATVEVHNRSKFVEVIAAGYSRLPLLRLMRLYQWANSSYLNDMWSRACFFIDDADSVVYVRVYRRTASSRTE